MAEFEGPLALLLSLIEARQLDVLTVPLGGLAEAYLDALATLDADRLGNVSSFVAVASQLILIKSRAMLPRRVVLDPTALPDEGPTPRPSCALGCCSTAPIATPACGWPRARSRGSACSDASRASPMPRRSPVRGPGDGPTLDPARLVRALGRLAVIAPPADLPPEVMARTITITERAAIIRDALRDAPTVVLQDLLAGVRDRVVIAITFLAMLELMKRREIVVEQAEPWGPIVARVDDRRGTGGRRRLADDEPLDESLESFA